MQKEKSEQSTTFETLSDNKLLQCIEQLKKQNQYMKKALETAQSLIQYYQKQNGMLAAEIKFLTKKIDNLEGSKFATFESDLKIKQATNMKQNSLIQNQRQQFGQQIKMLHTKIKQFIAIQDKYQQKISDMQHKIKLLQRNHLQNNLNKQGSTLCIELSNDIFCMPTSHQRQKDKKPKNLSELRQLHMRLKNKQLECNSVSQKGKNYGIVQRVFSKQTIKDLHSVKSTKKKRPQSSLSVKKR